MKSRMPWTALAALLSLGALLAACAGSPAASATGNSRAAPGTIENRANPNMAAVAAVAQSLNLAEDEAAIFYWRADGKYDEYGYWLWAYGDGDGSKNWDISKDLTVANGVAYLRFKLDGSNLGQKPINAVGEFGFIVRKDSGWEGQSKDFIWNTSTKGRVVVFFDGGVEPEAVGDYKPFFKGAFAKSTNLIEVTLSGRHALTLNENSSGFTVSAADGSRTLTVVDARPAEGPRDLNFTDKMVLQTAEDLPIDMAYVVNHPQYFAPERIDTSNLTALVADKTVPPRDLPLGAIYDPAARSVTFRVWSPFASAVKARLYGRSITVAGRNSAPDYQLDLVKDAATGLWSGTFDQRDPEGLFYDYVVTTNRGEKVALDPYARSMDAYMNEGGAGRGAIINLASPRAQPAGGWEGYTDIHLAQREDAIIYELHVRDFTISPDSGVTPALKGTYLGFIEKLAYLKDLGVTHVQLLPVLNFYYTDETNRRYEATGTTHNNNYNWGYDPHNYFTPEGWFATDASDPYKRISELKTLIKEIHKAGLGVILDVVYNHMGNTNLLEDLVPDYYFRKNANGTFTSMSGVGNDIASNRAMARRLIQDSLVHWVKEYNVDGFRFDLMGLTDADTILGALEEIRKIPGKDDILFEGEGWQMYNNPDPIVPLDQKFMTQTDGVAVFNDEIRNLLKGGGLQETARAYLTGITKPRNEIYFNLIGQPQKIYTADDPGDSMLYVTAHDNLNLHDVISHNGRISPTTPEGKAEIARRMKLAYFLIGTGQGILFLHGGDEMGRTKPNVDMKNTSEVLGAFVKNSYDSADNINQIVWTVEPVYASVQAFTRNLLHLRRATPAFRLGTQEAVNQAAKFHEQTDPFSFAYSVTHAGETWYILTNAAKEAKTLVLDRDVSAATVIADIEGVDPAGRASPAGVAVSGRNVTLEGLSLALLRVKN